MRLTTLIADIEIQVHRYAMSYSDPRSSVIGCWVLVAVLLAVFVLAVVIGPKAMD